MMFRENLMTDSALAQMFVVAIVAAGFIAALAAGAAVLTLLRRRRMAKAEALPVAQTSALKRAAEAPPTPAVKTAPPAPAPRPEAAITPPVVDSAEPPALLIEPEAGPTQRERDIQRLIEHLKSDDSAN